MRPYFKEKYGTAVGDILPRQLADFYHGSWRLFTTEVGDFLPRQLASLDMNPNLEWGAHALWRFGFTVWPHTVSRQGESCGFTTGGPLEGRNVNPNWKEVWVRAAYRRLFRPATIVAWASSRATSKNSAVSSW